MELRQLADMAPAAPVTTPDNPLEAVPAPSSGDALPKALANDRALAALLRAEQLLEKAARARAPSFQPEVVGAFQYFRLVRYNNWDQYFTSFKADTWAVGISVGVPILAGGRIEEARAKTAARLTRATSDRRARERDLDFGVQRAEAAAEETAADLGLARREAALSEEALQLALATAAEGRGEADAVARAQAGRAEARERLLEAGRRALEKRLDLLDIRGELGSLLRM